MFFNVLFAFFEVLTPPTNPGWGVFFYEKNPLPRIGDNTLRVSGDAWYPIPENPSIPIHGVSNILI